MRRNWLVAAAVAGLAAIVLAILVARVTDDDLGRIEPAVWAESVCSTLVDWRSSITALADVSGEPLTADSLRDRLDEARAATEELVAALRALGPPDVEQGEEVEEALDDVAAGIESSYRSLEQAAQDALDAESPTEFIQELAGLADDFQRLLDQAREAVAALQSASLFGGSSTELQRAFAEAESCQALAEEG